MAGWLAKQVKSVKLARVASQTSLLFALQKFLERNEVGKLLREGGSSQPLPPFFFSSSPSARQEPFILLHTCETTRAMNFLVDLLRDGRKQEKQTKLSELLDIRGNAHRTIHAIQFRNARLTLVEVPPSLKTNPTFNQESPFATWIVTIGKVRLPITTTTEIHPKPFQPIDVNDLSSVPRTSTVEPRRLGLVSEEKLLLTLLIDENGGYVQFKFPNEQSFQQWQTALCDALRCLPIVVTFTLTLPLI